jgi:hypothetical protein
LPRRARYRHPPPGPPQLPRQPRNLRARFRRHIVYATDPKTSADHFFYCGTSFTNNLFFNMPAYGTNAITADPKFTGNPR